MEFAYCGLNCKECAVYLASRDTIVYRKEAAGLTSAAPMTKIYIIANFLTSSFVKSVNALPLFFAYLDSSNRFTLHDGAFT